MKERDQLEDIDVDGTTLKSTLYKQDERAWTGLTWLRMGQVAVFCEHGNEPSGTTKCRKCLDWLRYLSLVHKAAAPWNQLITLSCWSW
jgi:hypothetical protein